MWSPRGPGATPSKRPVAMGPGYWAPVLQEKFEIVPRCPAACEPGDHRAVRKHFHPDLVVDLTARRAGQLHTHAMQGVFDAGGEDVVAPFRERGRGKGSGLSIEALEAVGLRE